MFYHTYMLREAAGDRICGQLDHSFMIFTNPDPHPWQLTLRESVTGRRNKPAFTLSARDTYFARAQRIVTHA